MSENDKPEASSKVGERLLWLSGHKVKVRLSYAELGQLASEEFVATHKDTYPLGREYFFCFEVVGKNRIVRTTAVVEMCEV